MKPILSVICNYWIWSSYKPYRFRCFILARVILNIIQLTSAVLIWRPEKGRENLRPANGKITKNLNGVRRPVLIVMNHFNIKLCLALGKANFEMLPISMLQRQFGAIYFRGWKVWVGKAALILSVAALFQNVHQLHRRIQSRISTTWI